MELLAWKEVLHLVQIKFANQNLIAMINKLKRYILTFV